ncbi:MAG: histidine phosphatase family protein [Sphingobium sp.]
MTRHIVIIRHGNTFASSAEARRIGARTDIPLTAEGRVQAERLGAHLASLRLADCRLFSGPLVRARETAGHIAAALNLRDIAIAPWLDEVDHGPDEGMPEADVAARLGTEALGDWDERGVAPPGWIVDRDARLAAWQRFFREAREGADLLVTSNGAARFALLAAGLGNGALKLRTGAFGCLTVRDGAISLAGWDERP